MRLRLNTEILPSRRQNVIDFEFVTTAYCPGPHACKQQKVGKRFAIGPPPILTQWHISFGDFISLAYV